GVNAFGDTDEAFLSPTWEEVATRDPDVIVDGSGGLEESMAALQDYLRKDSALSRMTAVENDSFLVIDYYDNVPGPRAVDGVVKLAEFLRG
ncbi:MAG: iron transporter, partial [Nocardioides sp.]|nr:iron transporter [Nocardioides sp.]